MYHFSSTISAHPSTYLTSTSGLDQLCAACTDPELCPSCLPTPAPTTITATPCTDSTCLDPTCAISSAQPCTDPACAVAAVPDIPNCQECLVNKTLAVTSIVPTLPSCCTQICTACPPPAQQAILGTLLPPTAATTTSLPPTGETTTSAENKNADSSTDSDSDETVSCKWKNCGKKFDAEQLGSHVSDSHIRTQKGTGGKRRKTKGFVCEWEGCSAEKLFRDAHNLLNHLRYRHTEEKPFACTEPGCAQRFVQAHSMRKHTRLIHQKNRRTESDQSTAAPASNNDNQAFSTDNKENENQSDRQNRANPIIEGSINPETESTSAPSTLHEPVTAPLSVSVPSQLSVPISESDRSLAPVSDTASTQMESISNLEEEEDTIELHNPEGMGLNGEEHQGMEDDGTDSQMIEEKHLSEREEYAREEEQRRLKGRKRRASGKSSSSSSDEAKPLIAPHTTTCRWGDCTLVFATVEELGSHVHDHIKQQKITNRREKRSGYVCEWDGCQRQKRVFKGCYNLEHHVRYQHTGEKPFACPKPWCDSKFAQQSDLKEHLRNIHFEQEEGASKKKRTVQKVGVSIKQEESSKLPKIMYSRVHPIPILPHPPFFPAAGFVLDPATAAAAAMASVQHLQQQVEQQQQQQLQQLQQQQIQQQRETIERHQERLRQLHQMMTAQQGQGSEVQMEEGVAEEGLEGEEATLEGEGEGEYVQEHEGGEGDVEHLHEEHEHHHEHHHEHEHHLHDHEHEEQHHEHDGLDHEDVSHMPLEGADQVEGEVQEEIHEEGQEELHDHDQHEVQDGDTEEEIHHEHQQHELVGQEEVLEESLGLEHEATLEDQLQHEGLEHEEVQHELQEHTEEHEHDHEHEVVEHEVEGEVLHEGHDVGVEAHEHDLETEVGLEEHEHEGHGAHEEVEHEHLHEHDPMDPYTHEDHMLSIEGLEMHTLEHGHVEEEAVHHEHEHEEVELEVEHEGSLMPAEEEVLEQEHDPGIIEEEEEEVLQVGGDES